jgi:hypothetical protein
MCPGLQLHSQGTCRYVAWNAALAAMYVSSYGLDSGPFNKGLLDVWTGQRRHLPGTCQFVGLVIYIYIYIYIYVCVCVCVCVCARARVCVCVLNCNWALTRWQ